MKESGDHFLSWADIRWLTNCVFFGIENDVFKNKNKTVVAVPVSSSGCATLFLDIIFYLFFFFSLSSLSRTLRIADWDFIESICLIFDILALVIRNELRVVVVAQMAERLLPIPEIHGLNPVIGKILSWTWIYCKLLKI